MVFLTNKIARNLIIKEGRKEGDVNMHATIQKSLEEIMSFIKDEEKVLIVGCDNCAAKCKSGGRPEAEKMESRLKEKGVNVTGWIVPEPAGASLCKLSNTKKVLLEDHSDMVGESDSVLVLSCGQGIHTVMDAVGDSLIIHPGCDTTFGGETTKDGELIEEFCSLCGQCIIEHTGGLCPLTLCSKGLLNGPCGGTDEGKCEVDANKDCGWKLIYERLKSFDRLDLLLEYQEPKNFANSNQPRQLEITEKEVKFTSANGVKVIER